MVFIFGLGMMVGYYVLTSYTIISAFFHGASTVIVFTNWFGEAAFEYVLTIFSIPFVVITVKEIIDLIKKWEGE